MSMMMLAVMSFAAPQDDVEHRRRTIDEEFERRMAELHAEHQRAVEQLEREAHGRRGGNDGIDALRRDVMALREEVADLRRMVRELLALAGGAHREADEFEPRLREFAAALEHARGGDREALVERLAGWAEELRQAVRRSRGEEHSVFERKLHHVEELLARANPDRPDGRDHERARGGEDRLDELAAALEHARGEEREQLVKRLQGWAAELEASGEHPDALERVRQLLRQARRGGREEEPPNDLRAELEALQKRLEDTDDEEQRAELKERIRQLRRELRNPREMTWY